MRAKVCLEQLSKFGLDSHRNGQQRRLTALVDPGSDHTMIEKSCLPPTILQDIYCYLNDKNYPNLHNVRLHKHSVVNTVNGQSQCDTISITVKAVIGKWHGVLELIVLETMNNEKFILGADFLNNYKANLQFGQGKESLFLEQTPTTVYARSIRSFQIKPNLEGHIEVELPSYLNNKDVLISPFDHSKQQFAIAYTVHRVHNNRIYVRYVNPSNRNITIAKFQPLAEVSTLTGHTIVNQNVTQTIQDPSNIIEKLSINKNLDPVKKEQLTELLAKYITAFSQSESDLGRTDLVQHSIRLNNDQPIKHAPYRVPPQKREIIQQKGNELKSKGVLIDSQSPFSSPVVLIRKKNGEWRFGADYRALNSATVKDAYPLPRIDDALDALCSNSHFTTLDLKSGYWQVLKTTKRPPLLLLTVSTIG
jgi:hypothetical protein